jgi:hypothetical protein
LCDLNEILKKVPEPDFEYDFYYKDPLTDLEENMIFKTDFGDSYDDRDSSNDGDERISGVKNQIKDEEGLGDPAKIDEIDEAGEDGNGGSDSEHWMKFC